LLRKGKNNWGPPEKIPEFVELEKKKKEEREDEIISGRCGICKWGREKKEQFRVVFRSNKGKGRGRSGKRRGEKFPKGKTRLGGNEKITHIHWTIGGGGAGNYQEPHYQKT